jgi:DNA-directed RNA polymerase specialized sigma24 family protein
MGLAAQQMAAAEQMSAPAAQPPVTAGELTPEQAHEAAIDAASRMAPKIAGMPRAMRKLQLDALRTSLDTLPPATRDACLQIYRDAGVKM